MKNTRKANRQDKHEQFAPVVNVTEIIAKGGATLNGDGVAVTFDNGYQVSRKDCYTISAEKIAKIKKAVNAILKSIAHEKNIFCGVWVDSGLVYIDISERIKNGKKALNIGKARKQKSVYDWRACDCIYL